MCTCLGQHGNCKLQRAVLVGKADADPSAFANEVLSPAFSYSLQPCTLRGTRSGLHWMGSEQKPKLGAAGSLLMQGEV